MSEGWATLVAVLVGALLTPVTQAAGYYFWRRHEQEDQRQARQRQTLVALQEAMIEVVDAKDAYDEAGPGGRDDAAKRLVVARRRVRMLAAQIGDDALSTSINSSLGGIEVTPVLTIRTHDDWFDESNKRGGELLAGLK